MKIDDKERYMRLEDLAEDDRIEILHRLIDLLGYEIMRDRDGLHLIEQTGTTAAKKNYDSEY